jgi:hypothetical protein
MKYLLPVGRSCSGGSVGRWVALFAALSISCFLVASAFASQHGGGGHFGGGGHSGGGHFGGGFHASSFHRSPSVPSNIGGNFSHGYHANLYAGHSESAHAVEHRGTVANNHGAVADHHTSTLDPRTNGAVNRTGATNRTIAQSHALGQTNRADPSPQNQAALANRTNTFDRSITTPRAQSLMSERLKQISGRQWGGHGEVWANHSDPTHGYWFQHGGYWWRGNFWGANSYCNNLIALGFAPGLCWGWYNDICWGNIVVGMPLDLVDYYYPDPVYSSYSTYDGDDSTYDGDEATVYYYALGDGQYQQITVIDGTVVDVQVVDQIQ